MFPRFPVAYDTFNGTKRNGMTGDSFWMNFVLENKLSIWKIK